MKKIYQFIIMFNILTFSSDLFCIINVLKEKEWLNAKSSLKPCDQVDYKKFRIIKTNEEKEFEKLYVVILLTKNKDNYPDNAEFRYYSFDQNDSDAIAQIISGLIEDSQAYQTYWYYKPASYCVIQ